MHGIYLTVTHILIAHMHAHCRHQHSLKLVRSCQVPALNIVLNVSAVAAIILVQYDECMHMHSVNNSGQYQYSGLVHCAVSIQGSTCMYMTLVIRSLTYAS